MRSLHACFLASLLVFCRDQSSFYNGIPISYWTIFSCIVSFIRMLSKIIPLIETLGINEQGVSLLEKSENYFRAAFLM